MQADEPQLTTLGKLHRMQPDLAAGRDNIGEARRTGQHAQSRHLEQSDHRRRKRPGAVEKLGGDRVEGGISDGTGTAALGLEPQSLGRHVVVGQVSVDRKLHAHVGNLG